MHELYKIKNLVFKGISSTNLFDFFLIEDLLFLPKKSIRDWEKEKDTKAKVLSKHNRTIPLVNFQKSPK